MKEKEPQKLENTISKELTQLKRINSLVTATLVTLDVAIPVGVQLLQEFPLRVDGWEVINSRRLKGFSERFDEVMGLSLTEALKKYKSRYGGSVYITERTILGLRPELVGGCFAPIGEEDESKSIYHLNKEININRKNLQKDPELSLNGRLFIKETISKGISPLILSLYHEKGRSMVLLRDDQEVKVEEEALSKLKAPHLVLVDARELIQESFIRETIGLTRDPKNFVVVGLGAESIMDQLTQKIKLLHAYTQGETGFAGNRGEVDALLANWGGVTNLSELMLQTKLRFLLETNGQNGATLHFRVGDKIHSAAFAIPREEIFKGDTTNAGDIFLGYVVNGLMDGSKEGESVEDWLYRILEAASKGTLEVLEKRARDAKENG